MSKFIFTTLFSLCVVVSSPSVFGQTLYKCAGAYQDRPCDSEIQSQYSATTGKFSNEKANPRSNLQCSKQGAIIQKIREDLDAGKSVDSVSTELAKNNGSKLHNKRVQDVVRDVSKMRGTPIQVRYEFEGDCTDQRATLAQQGSSGNSAYRNSSAADAARAAAEEARQAAQEAKIARRSRY